MNNNLDVWAIQNYPEELKSALSGLETKGEIIIFSNVVCSFNLGGIKIKSKQFDTFLYSEESDRLVMLMRGGKTTKEDIIQELENQGITNYHEVILSPSEDEHMDGNIIPEIWIAREEYVLDDALKDSSKKESSMTGDYYPNLCGYMSLDYLTSHGARNQLNKRIFKGLIQMDDKTILLVNNGEKRNIMPYQVYDEFTKYGFSCNPHMNGVPQVLLEERKVNIR